MIRRSRVLGNKSRCQRKRFLKADRHFRSPRVEALESRRVLATTISGHVVNDLDADGIVDGGEPGQGLVTVYVDANGNDMLDVVGEVFEPDDYQQGMLLNDQVTGVTFTVADRSNSIITDNPDEVVSVYLDDFASTGAKVFGRGTSDDLDVPFFNDRFRLRMDFQTPISELQIDFIGTRTGAVTNFGILEAYDAEGNLVDDYRTAGLVDGDSETMTATGEISYAVAYTEFPDIVGRLDSLRVGGLNSEIWTLTDLQGRYTLNVPSGGTYRINEVVPDGFIQTSPDGDGGQTVVLTTDAALENVDFTNTEAVNQGPIANDDTLVTAEDVSQRVDVLANDTDDGTLDASSIVIVTGPTNGTATIDGVTGEIEYTPNANYNGSDSLTYTVNDDEGATSNVALVEITVSPINDPPSAVDDEAETDSGTPVTIDVLLNDTDVDGTLQPASVVVAAGPEQGTVSVNSETGAITYTPPINLAGTETFTYTVADNGGTRSNEATVTVVVSRVAGWQNPVNPLDVDDDGLVIPRDALLIINELNRPEWRDPESGLLPDPPNPVPAFFDVDGNGFATPADAIFVINELNRDNAPAAIAAADAPPATTISQRAADQVAAALDVNAALPDTTSKDNFPSDSAIGSSIDGNDDSGSKRVELEPSHVDRLFS